MIKNNELNSSFKTIEKYLYSTESIINHVSLLDSYNDYPRFFQYITRHKPLPNLPYLDILSNGISLDENTAIGKAIMEAVERWYLASYDTGSFIFGSYNDLKKQGKNAISPIALSQFSKTQLKHKRFAKFRVDNDDKYYWTKSKNLSSDDTVLIPAHIINFMPEKDLPKKIIYTSDSSGAAAGTSLEMALYNGVCELLERDAYSIMYYNRLPVKKVDFTRLTNQRILSLISYIKSYYFEIMVFEITLDIDIPIFFSVITDETDFGPQITVGAKCSLDWRDAMQGSILESFQGRSFLRDLTTIQKYGSKAEEYISPKSNEVIFKRFKFWAHKENKNKLNFLLNNEPKPIRKFSNIPNNTAYADKLKILLKKLRTAGIKNIYWVKTTPTELDEYSIFGVKVVIPALQRISLDALYPHFGHQRMSDVPIKLGYLKKSLPEDQYNKFPHPLP